MVSLAQITSRKLPTPDVPDVLQGPDVPDIPDVLQGIWNHIIDIRFANGIQRYSAE